MPCEGLDLKSAVLMVRLWFHTQMHKTSHKCTTVEVQIKGFIYLLLLKLTTASGQVWFASATLHVGSPTVPVLCQKIIAGI